MTPSNPSPLQTPSKHATACGCTQAGSAVADGPLIEPAGTHRARSTVFRIATMDCAAEEGEIRHALAAIADIRSLRFQLAARTLAIDASPAALPLALAAIRKAGFQPEPLGGDTAPSGSSGHADHDHGATHPNVPSGLPKLVAALLLALFAESLAFWAPSSTLFTGLGMALAAAAIALAGFSTYTKGLAALRQGRLNINALMTVAVSGAFLIGQWPEAAMVMALYALAELIEARAVDRARGAIQNLLNLAPETAEVQQPDGTWHTLAAQAAAIDAIVRVKPGARIPVDGTITLGHTAVDQAAVTGESIPLDKAVGDPVYAGTINTTGLIQVRVTALASNSLLSRIIHAVEQAQGSRAPTQQFVDRFAAIYTPAVFALALGVAVLTPLVLDWTWLQALYKALVLLVIACPCALVISTPVTVVSGLAAAARHGILVKGGVHLERARKIKAIALDKTGTLTEGKPRLVATELLDAPVAPAQVLQWAASLAGHSDHPVSKAIAQGLEAGHDRLDAFHALPGRGVQAQVNGQTLRLGNHRLMEELQLCSPALEARLAVHEEQGRTVTLLASDSHVLAIFAVADTLKPSARDALAQLHALGVATVMLSGDNTTTVQAIAEQAGLRDARGNLLPQDKLDAIEGLQRQWGFTAMVGDGINDAPALARADMGFAMGAVGTDTAMEAADVVIMNDDLHNLAATMRLSGQVHTVLWQNIALALGIKGVFLVLAILGSATMWMAVFADMGASLLVVFNGLREPALFHSQFIGFDQALQVLHVFGLCTPYGCGCRHPLQFHADVANLQVLFQRQAAYPNVPGADQHQRPLLHQPQNRVTHGRHTGPHLHRQFPNFEPLLWPKLPLHQGLRQLRVHQVALVFKRHRVKSLAHKPPSINNIYAASTCFRMFIYYDASYMINIFGLEFR